MSHHSNGELGVDLRRFKNLLPLREGVRICSSDPSGPIVQQLFTSFTTLIPLEISKTTKRSTKNAS